MGSFSPQQSNRRTGFNPFQGGVPIQRPTLRGSGGGPSLDRGVLTGPDSLGITLDPNGEAVLPPNLRPPGLTARGGGRSPRPRPATQNTFATTRQPIRGVVSGRKTGGIFNNLQAQGQAQLNRPGRGPRRTSEATVQPRPRPIRNLFGGALGNINPSLFQFLGGGAQSFQRPIRNTSNINSFGGSRNPFLTLR